MIATVTLNAAVDKRYVVEKFEYGGVNRVAECNYSAGGKGINVARASHILGEKVIAAGFIAGSAGQFIIDELTKTGINTAFTKVNGESRSCVDLYDKSTGKQTELLEAGITVSEDKQQEFVRSYEELIKPCSVTAICGSAPKGIDKFYYTKLIRIAKNQGKKVILDTSGEFLVEGIKEKPDFIKPNRDEIKYLLGTNVDGIQELSKAAEDLYNSGIENVVISLGKDGAIFACREGIYKGNTPNIQVVNTVGCGDSMVAAFAIGLSKNISAKETFKSALAVSTANAMTEKAGYFIKKDYINLINSVTVEKLK